MLEEDKEEREAEKFECFNCGNVNYINTKNIPVGEIYECFCPKCGVKFYRKKLGNNTRKEEE